MELRVLRYFLAVAQEQNITAAAKVLHISQPTLSRQLMDLEAELGKQLMQRGSRSITLTEEGMVLKKRAEEIIALVDRTESELHAPEDQIAGDVYIGSAETQGMRYLAKIIRQMQQQHPGIHFHLHSGNAADVMERLDKGLLDFGLLLQPADIHKYDSIHLPYQDIWGVLMRKDSPLAQKSTITPADLQDKPLLCSRQVVAGSEMANWFGRAADELNIVVTYNLIYNAAILVEEGVGYALTLDKLVRESADSAVCFRPFSPAMTVQLDVVWKKYQLFSSKAADLFHKELERVFRQ